MQDTPTGGDAHVLASFRLGLLRCRLRQCRQGARLLRQALSTVAAVRGRREEDEVQQFGNLPAARLQFASAFTRVVPDTLHALAEIDAKYTE